MKAAVPLLAHTSPGTPVAYRAGKPIPAWQFIADVQHVGRLIPRGAAVFNACTDRYRFAVGLGATIIAEGVTLLPPTQTAEVMRQIRAMNLGALCLTDHRRCTIDLPQIMFPDGHSPRTSEYVVPRIPARRVVANVFTSGSTGVPLPHRKRWGPLMDCMDVAAERLGFEGITAMTIVATVPPQHMYGLENSVLLTMRSGHAFCAERPFYPSDISTVLAAAPAPRSLLSTPVHLRALLESNVELPPLQLVISATAPLDKALAQQVEQRFGVPLAEIYGSTESGQIATRRPTQCLRWRLHTGVKLTRKGERAWASGGHIEKAVPLGDHIESLDGEYFELGDRLQDVINIAGKRSSIAYLNHQLLTIPGVRDGAFFLPREPRGSSTRVTRLCALVVAPGMDATTLLRQLRERIDPAFIPRPLRFVAALPRNTTGKLSLQILRSLLDLG